MTETSRAVFLSYASQDAEAARRICEALRAAGIEVWFDQSELRGGDVWDQKIRREVHDCALFIPVISANTASRHEGYFRLEWDLADQRTHMIARNRAFIVPVCLDATPDAGADVPESFQRVQWTRLAAGETPAAFVERIAKLLSPVEPVVVATHTAAAPRQPVPSLTTSRQTRRVLLLIAAVAVIGAGYLAVDRFIRSKRPAIGAQTSVSAGQSAAPAAAAIPEKSVAVLPFVDMSERHDQEYLADGLAEELIDSLTKLPDLHVPARTSSFRFKGRTEDIVEIARRLRVSYIVEGSVRVSGRTLRVTTQLIQANSGYHIWSETYERRLDDVFKLQDEITSAVVTSLKASLVSDVPARLTAAPNEASYLLYLRAQHAWRVMTKAEELPPLIQDLEHAISLSPEFADAWALLAKALIAKSEYLDSTRTASMEKAMHAANQALLLDSQHAASHIAVGAVHYADWDWAGAEREFRTAVELEPRNTEAIRRLAQIKGVLGQFQLAADMMARAVVLDPLESWSYFPKSEWNLWAGRYADAEVAVRELIELEGPAYNYSWLSVVQLLAGKTTEALESVQRDADQEARQQTLPLVYFALGRRADSDSALAALETRHPKGSFCRIAEIHAFRGERDQAFVWLERAVQVHEPHMQELKGAPLLKNLESDPRYKRLLREMKLPQ